VSPPSKRRAIEALLACVARYGLTKTSLDDVARVAGCGRATLYRHFGDRGGLIAAAITYERSRLDRALSEAVGDTPSADAAVVAVVQTTARFVHESAAITSLLDHEPATVLPWLAFERGSAVLVALGEHLAEPLRPWFGETAPRVGEWLARLLMSYLVHADEREALLDTEVARGVVANFVLPGLGSDALLTRSQG